MREPWDLFQEQRDMSQDERRAYWRHWLSHTSEGAVLSIAVAHYEYLLSASAPYDLLAETAEEHRSKP
jgi:hypothetical protein